MNFADFGGFISTLQKNQAIIHGVPKSRENQQLIVTKDKFNHQPNTIPRTKDYFEFSGGYALFVIDYDPGPEQEYLTPEEMIETIALIFPHIKKCARVVQYSTSSFIYDQNDQPVGNKNPGYHIYFIVKSGTDIPRFNDVLFKRLILAGLGYVFITKSGSQLIRTLMDKTVNSPERLDFVAGAECYDGMKQKRPEPLYHEGDVLDTALLADLTASEEEEYEQVVANLKRESSEKAKKIRDEYETKEVGKLVQKGLSQDQSEKIVRHRLDGNLAPGDQIRSDKYGWIDVSELLINPEKFDGETFSDPLEPEYGGGRNKAKFFVNSPETGGSHIIHSFAHGGRNFYLTNNWDLEVIKTIFQKKNKGQEFIER